MKQKRITLIILLLICNVVFSQKFNFNRVTIAELEEKAHPVDSTAAAAYLHKSGTVSFELSPEGYFTLVEKVKCKIKIYTKSGYSFADVEIPYYTGGKTVNFYLDDAATFNLVNNKVERTKLKSTGEFKDKVNENYSVKKITFPNVKEGSIIEYSYLLKTPYYNFFPDWYFQHSIPVNRVEYEVLIPQFFGYKFMIKGFEKIHTPPQEFVNASNGRYKETRVRYEASNIQALKEEPFVNNVDNYRSMIQYELSTTNFPDKGLQSYTTGWRSITKTIYESEAFGQELSKTSYFEADLEALLEGVVGRDERIAKIFDYVKNTMNWNQKNGYYTDLGVKKAYAEKIGNVADINLMLVAMMRKALIKCNPILVSTRSNGISLFPDLGSYNYVIAGVELENGTLLLDATTKNTVPNILPIRVLNWKGRLLRDDNTSVEIDLMPSFNSKEISTIAATIDLNGKVAGKVRKQSEAYNGYLFREKYSTLSKESYIETLESKYSGLFIEKYNLLNEKEPQEPIIESYDFVSENSTEFIENKIYLTPMLFLTKKENPFKQETRLYPIDFSFPFQDKYNFIITIPEGYKIESLPESVEIGIEQNIANFKYIVTGSGKEIKLNVLMEINYSNVDASFYDSLKEYFRKMIDKQSEKIVLIKI